MTNKCRLLLPDFSLIWEDLNDENNLLSFNCISRWLRTKLNQSKVLLLDVFLRDPVIHGMNTNKHIRYLFCFNPVVDYFSAMYFILKWCIYRYVLYTSTVSRYENKIKDGAKIITCIRLTLLPRLPSFTIMCSCQAQL